MTTCKDCESQHGPECLKCTETRCTECINNRFLWRGKCFDCSLYPNSLECNEEGAIKCRTSFFLEKDESGIGYCHPCSDHLDHCLECSTRDKCDKCSHDFFVTNGDGQCSCKGGNNAIFDHLKEECTCKAGHLLTTEGCRTC